jgi:hypothetical protein
VYVGSGQIGDSAAAESASYGFALAEAQRRGNRRALRELREIGPPPYPAAAVFTERTWLSRLEGRMSPRYMWKVGRAVLAGSESSILELPDTMRGLRFSMEAMWPVGPSGDQRGVYRRADRAVQAGRLVRAVGP